jgi:TRAP-type C4-dicarboxylate transport system permease small subunit
MSDATTGWFGRLNGRVSLWLARVAAWILALLAAITFIDVVARYVFNAPLTFTVEITEFAMGLMVYFGMGLTTHHNEHISVDVVTLRLRERLRAVLALITNLVALGFLVLLVWRLWLRAELLFDKGDITPIWGLPLWPVAYLMAFGSVFLLTGILLQTVVAWQRLAGGQPPDQPQTRRQSYE